jgi:hypothetical protein
LKKKWLDLIYDEEKVLEIRPYQCQHLVGKRIFFSASGAKTVSGSAVVEKTIGPLDVHMWDRLRTEHCVPGERLYGDNTWAWRLKHVKRNQHLLPIRHTIGAIGMQKGPG